MTETNPLFDGTFKVKVGTAAEKLAGTMHDFTSQVLGPPAAPDRVYDNTNPGGFGGFSFRIAASSPFAAFAYLGHTMTKGDKVLLTHGTGGGLTTLYEGEITSDVSRATVEGGLAFYDATCAGLWWKAGQRGDFCHVWGDDDFSQWFEMNSGGPFQVDTDGKLDIRLEAGQNAKAGSEKCLYYWLDSGMGDPAAVASVLFGVVTGNVADKDSATWHADISTSDSPWGTWTVQQSWANEAIASGTPLWVPTTNARALRLRIRVAAATSTGTTADRYITITKVAVCSGILADFVPAHASIDSISKASPALVTTGDHGLKTGDRIFLWMTDSVPSCDGWHTVATTPATNTFTCTGMNVGTTAGTTGNYSVGWRVDEALAEIATSTGLAGSTNLQAGGIGNANWGLNVRPHASCAEAIDALSASYADPIDHGFWDGGVYYCKERIAAAGVHDILLDATDPGIDWGVFANTEESPTHVKVLYTFRDVVDGSSVYPDGTLLAVYRPSAPAWFDAAVVLDVWDQWADLSLETGQAEDIGDQILAWIAYNKYVGSVTIATPTVPLRGGGTRNTAYIRAGDYVDEATAALGAQMVTSASMDVDNGVMTLGIGETRKDFVARIMPRLQPKHPHPRFRR